MRPKFTHGSLFSGSGGFDEAAWRNGIESIWCSEIEPFPIRVLRRNFPNAKQLGDVSKVRGDRVAPVDVISGGSPCQDMSVAGKRAGLKGSRSGLFYEQVRIVKEMREKTNGEYPRFMVWENVKGAFSSNKGEDFRCVLEEIANVAGKGVSIPRPKKWAHAGCILGDGWSIAWRLFDAQYWGVPQRRQRIYLVADFRGESASEILFKPESVSGHTQTSEGAAQGIAGSVKSSFGETGRICLNDQGGNRMDVTEDVTCTLRAEAHHPPVVMDEELKAAGFCTEHSANSRSIGYEEEVSPTLRAGTVPAVMLFENHSQDSRYTGPLKVSQTVSATFGMGGNNQPFVVQPPKAFGVCSKSSNAMLSDNPNSGFYEATTARTLDLNGGSPACNQGGMAVVCLEGNGQRPSHQGDGWHEGDPMYTLNSTEHHAVAVENHPSDSRVKMSEDGVVQTLSGRMGTGGGNVPMVMETCNATTGSFMRAGNSGIAETLMARDYKDPQVVAYGLDRAAFNRGKNAKFDFSVEEEKIGAQVARGLGAVCQSVVRRLTPLECARLQGFPDWWCDDLTTTDEEDVRFFLDVWFRYWTVTQSSKSPKTEGQVRKWLANEPSDSDVYKMWGNGVALPNVEYIFRGIRRILEND